MMLKSRPILFFLILFLTIGSLEAAIRINEKIFSSLQDGTLLKLQMFRLRNKTEILFLGTSRTQDGLDPSLIADSLATLNEKWRGSRGFNGSSAGGSLNRILYSLNDALDKPDLKLLGIELSEAQLSSSEWIEPDKQVKVVQPANFEEHIQQFMSENIGLIKHRKSFRLENIIKLPFLIWPDMDDGTQWFGQVGGKYKSLPSTRKNLQWQLHSNIEQFKEVSMQGSLFPGEERYLPGFQKIAEKARQRGVQLFFYTPPVRGHYALSACDENHIRTYLTIAKLNHIPLFIPSCEEAAPAEYFSDESHLNREGKRVWSIKLAQELINSKL